MMSICGSIEMTRWKDGETEFTVKLSDDGRHSTICRVPRPIKDLLNNPISIKFIIDGDKIRIERKE